VEDSGGDRSDDDFPGVEISIAGGVEVMVVVGRTNFFFFFFRF